MSAKTFQAKVPVSTLLPASAANRTAATVDAVAVTMQPVTTPMLVPSIPLGRMATRLVAAADASAQMKAMADYICDGSPTNNDQVEINAALASLPTAGGTVLLSEGTFHLSAPISALGHRITLSGQGMGATVLRVVDNAPAPANTATLQLAGDYTTVTDLTVDGNKSNGNTGLNGYYGIYVVGGNASTVLRARVLNAPLYGIVVHVISNVVVRDCIVEGAANVAFLIRGAAGAPNVLTGCVAKNNSGGAFSFDSGPVAVSDCVALNNVAHGFSVGTGTLITFRNCTAKDNTGVGFSTSGPRTIFSHCRTIGNGTNGYQTAGAATQFIGCMAQAPAQHGFAILAGATDALVSGCVTADTLGGYAGFHHESTGKTLFMGCRAYNFAYWAFRAVAGEIQVRNCQVYGYAAQSTAITLEGGAGHVIDGCRILNNGGYGIFSYGGTSNVAIMNNRISESSLLGNDTYFHTVVDSANTFLSGNMWRDPAAGARPKNAMQSNALNTCLGTNDSSGSGYSGEIGELQSATLRKAAKSIFSYTVTTNLMGSPTNTTLTGGQWYVLIPNQTFRVDSQRDMIEIHVSGNMLIGSNAATAFYLSRLLLDDVTQILLGGEHAETTGYYQNPLAGAAPVKLTNLAIGNHTVSLSIRPSQTSLGYLRNVSLPDYEFLTLQGVEYQRS